MQKQQLTPEKFLYDELKEMGFDHVGVRSEGDAVYVTLPGADPRVLRSLRRRTSDNRDIVYSAV